MREKIVKFKNEFKKQSIIAIMAAFGFLIALTWRDFITELITHVISYFKLTGSLYIYKLVGAILVTLIAVIGIMIVSKFNSEENIKK